MTEIVTINPDGLAERTAATADLYTLVFAPGGALQKIAFGNLLSKLIASDLCKNTEVDLQADLAHDADAVALVINDPTAEKNGWWRKVGATTTGNWAQFEVLTKVAREEAFTFASRASLVSYLAGQPFANATELNAYANSLLEVGDRTLTRDGGLWLVTSLTPLTWTRQADSDGKKAADSAAAAAASAAAATPAGVIAALPSLTAAGALNGAEILGASTSGGARKFNLFDIATYLGVTPPSPAPVFDSQPSISGTPAIGEVLTGSDGTFRFGTVSARAWLRNGSVISGATGTSYTPVTADTGANISYRVSLTGTGGSTSATSTAVGPVTDPLVSTIPAPQFRDDFNSGTANLNGRAGWFPAYLAGQSGAVNAVSITNQKAGGTTGAGMFAVTSGGPSLPIVKRRMSINQIGSGTLIDHATFTAGGGVTGFVFSMVNSASGGNLNALLQYQKFVNNTTTSITSQACGRALVGDNVRSEYYTSAGNTLVNVFHNGWSVLAGIDLTSQGVTFTGQSGIKGNIGAAALDEIEIVDSTTQAWIGLRWGTRVVARNADGSVTLNIDVAYGQAAPSTLVYTIFDLNTGSEVALTGHNAVRRDVTVSGGFLRFQVNVAGALLASGGPFVTVVERDRLLSSGKSVAYSPQWRPGLVELSGGQSLRIGMSTVTFATTDAYAPPADGQHTLGTPVSSATLGAENLRYSYALDTNRPPTAWQAALAGAGFPVATASGGISATPIATRGVGTACHNALKECLDRHLRRANFIGWMDGQSDIGDDTSAYQAALLAISSDLEAYCGYIVPIKIEPLAASWYGASFHDIRWQLMRRTQWKLCQDYPTRFFYGAHALDIQHDTGSNGILHPSANGYGVLGTRCGKRTLRLLGLLAHDPNGPSLASVTRISATQVRCVYNLNGWDSLRLANTAYASNFNGGMIFSTAPTLTTTTIASKIAATGATVDAAPAGGQQGINFTFPAGTFPGSVFVWAAFGQNPFNPADNGSNTDAVNLDLSGKASMIQGVKAGELNTALQPYFTADGLDYMTAS